MLIAVAAVLIGMPGGPAAEAASPDGISIAGSCFYRQGTSPNGPVVPNNSTLVLTPGDSLTVDSVYSAKDTGSSTLYFGDFTTTLAGNALTGPAHTIYTEQLYAGAGWSTGGGHETVLPTGGWSPGTTATLSASVTSTFTGTDILGTCSITVEVLDPNGDADGDGLLNKWETSGIDGDGDGTTDLVLPGANPLHKDAYVEVDWMDCTAAGSCDTAGIFPRPTHDSALGVVVPVTDAFSRAPVANPDGITGIALHIAVDEPTPPAHFTQFGPPSIADASHDATFDQLKSGDPAVACDGHFGTAVERQLPTCATVLAARKMAYRYAIVGANIADGASSVIPAGIAEIGGNDFFVTADWSSPADIITDANTFMHELGHTLGLRHGGSDDINCKPNYLSIMNYALPWSGPNVDHYPLDYSRETLPTLNEANLSEPAGVGYTGTRWTAWGVPGNSYRAAPAQGPLDFNGNGVKTDIGVVSDLNNLGPASICPQQASPGQSLVGFDDWAHISLNFRNSVDYGDYQHATAAEVHDPSFEQLAASNLTDGDNDSVPDQIDNCPTTANPSQADRDTDGLGDACDPDSDPPVITVTTPADGAAYQLHQAVNAAYQCVDLPAGGSGLASCTGSVPDGASLDTNAVGARTFTVIAADNDGHAARADVSYRIAYGFAGFAQPVDNGGVYNVATAGRTIPLKWQLTDATGTPVTTLTRATVTTVRVPCTASAPVDAVESYATSNSGLLNLGAGNYQLNWQTAKNLAGSCQQLRLDLGEGAPRTALFSFTR
jgi:hypothetical protein